MGLTRLQGPVLVRAGGPGARVVGAVWWSPV